MGCGCGGPQFTNEDLDPELPSEADMVRFGYRDETVVCEECREEIYDDADVCPHCGAFQLRSSAGLSGKANRGIWRSLDGLALPLAVVLVIVGLLLLTAL